jgi:hypothetical protein
MFDRQMEHGEVGAPQPLDIKAAIADAAEFPINALPPLLRDAILAIEAIAQVPVSLAAQSVLSAASLAAQGFINVETITGQFVPVSLFMFTIAASGDRKSTSDRLAIQPVKEREEQLAVQYETDKIAYSIAEAAYKAATNKAKSSAKGVQAIKEALEDCGKPPLPPVQPLLTADEPTGPGLQRLFAEAMSSLGLFSDEGATFLGGWAMQEENQAATGGMLSKLWDGSPIKRIRAGTENGSTILFGRRLCLHLMVQPDIAGKLLGNKAVRSQGLLSRILPVAPKSLKGSRFYREPSEDHRAHLRDYQARLGRLLAQEPIYREPTSRALDLAIVNLKPDARAKLIEFSDHCERHIGPGGKYEQISDFASKMAENAVRIAAVISYFVGGRALISEGLSERAVTCGMALMEFYASEASRLYGTPSVDDDTANAVALIEWIRKRELTHVGKQFLNRHGPTQVRNAAHLTRAIEILEEYNHLVRVKGGLSLDLNGRGAKFYKDAYAVVPIEAE